MGGSDSGSPEVAWGLSKTEARRVFRDAAHRYHEEQPRGDNQPSVEKTSVLFTIRAEFSRVALSSTARRAGYIRLLHWSHSPTV